MDELINRQAAIKALRLPDYENGEAYIQYEEDLNAIKELPSVQSEILMCKDCKYWKNQNTSTRWLPCMDIQTDGRWYCGSAERREDG